MKDKKNEREREETDLISDGEEGLLAAEHKTEGIERLFQ